MAKATKSRKPDKGGRKSGAKVKPRKPSQVAKGPAKKANQAKKAVEAKAQSSQTKSASVLKKPVPGPGKMAAPAPQSIKTGAAAAILERPERPVVRDVPARSVPARSGSIDQQPAESETPPALPVPIASFTF